MYGQSIFLDPTFGNGGKVVTPIDSMSLTIRDMVIQPDGKILVVGRTQLENNLKSGFVIVRYNIDGSLDNTFGSGGLIIDFFSSSTSNQASQTIELQSDGKIIVGGNITIGSTRDFALVRYYPNGTIDSTFGNNGLVTTDFGAGNIDAIYQTIVKSNDKILTAGLNTGLYGTANLVQYTSNGSLDSTFGNSGLARSPQYYSGFSFIGVLGLTIQSDDKIVAVGFSNKWEVVRFLPNGKIDSTYGDTGRVKIDIVGQATSISLQNDGKAIVFGFLSQNNHNSIVLIRLRTNGLLDSTFGSGGIAINDIDTSNNSASKTFIQSDGKILVAGTNSEGSVNVNSLNKYRGNFVLLRYNNNGILDSSFGVQGIITTDFGLQDFAFTLVVQTDGKVILGGNVSDSIKYNMGLARYNFNALPLSLLSFTATQQQSTNLLQWKTSNEINVDRFDIQRSSDGRDFTTIGNVRAGLNNYYFTDEQPIANTNYYRLKMIDKDGRYSFSPVRMVTVSSDVVFSIYPNPASDKLHVQILSKKKSSAQIEVLTLDGKIIRTTNWDISEGTSIKTLGIAALHSGSYLLKIASKNRKAEVLKFEKL